ncbi:unnamed protein product, partial [Ectocarpus sp. 8 AP-2014]
MFSGGSKGPLEEITRTHEEKRSWRHTGGQQQAVNVSNLNAWARFIASPPPGRCLKWNLGTKNAMRRCRWRGGTAVDGVPGPPEENSRADAATQLRILRLVRQLIDPDARPARKQFAEIKERVWRRLQPSWRPIRVQAGTSAGRERGRQRLTLLWERGTTATPPTHASAQT